MVVPFRTFAVFGLALGMLAAGYLVRPAPGAAALSPTPAPKVVAAAAPKPVSTLAANRPPVPIVGPQHANYFAIVDQGPNTASDKPSSDASRLNGNPSDPAQTQTAALTTDQPSGGDINAKRAIEVDGYKNVRDIVKDADGGWRARAMRGRTEISVKVDANGNVSAE